MSDTNFKETQFLRRKDPGEGAGEIGNKISGARFIAETLKGYKVTHVFFVESILNRALVEMEDLGIRRVLAHSEKSAAYMADGYARASNKPGVCMAQSVGSANLASGLQDPFLGLSPVIAITAKKPPLAQHRNAYQEILHMPLFEPVTKYNVSVDTVEQLPYLLRQAFREATSGAPGPVHLELIGHLGQVTETGEAAMDVVIEEAFTTYPSVRPEPEPERLVEAVRILEAAERPVIIAGGGARASSAGPEILRLAEMLSIPVATSLAGKEILIDSHPLNVGVVGTYSRRCANRVVSEADLVLFIGCHTGDQVTLNWTIPAMYTPVIQIDIDPLELGRSYPNAVPLVGDAKVSVRKLQECLEDMRPKKVWAERAQGFVKEWRDEAEPMRNSDATPIRVERLCKEITDVLPSDGILVVDTGNSGIWTGTMFCLTHPGQGYIPTAGSLGWAFPASLGVKCGAPDRPVVCFTGDGGIFYHLSELETASRYGIKTVTVVNNNHGLRQVLGLVNMAYEDRSGNRGELYQFKDVNFANIAREMGCFGVRVERPQEIAGALREALASDLPAVVDVVTDTTCRAQPPWSPGSK